MRKQTRLLFSASGVLALLGSLIVLGMWPANAAVAGVFKVDCTFVKSAPIDPIVYPGLPGASHDHAFFGSVGIDAWSTFSSMQGYASTCAKNDRSAYWAPSLYKDGQKIAPSAFIAYYENRFPAGTKVEPFPAGFRMIFGNKNATTAAQVDGHIEWGCSGNTQLGGKEPPASCPTGVIQLRFLWPYCWDGVSTGDATTHMSFAPGGACPAKFPHHMPTIRTNIQYPVGTTTGNVTFSSGSVYSAHEDFLDGWDPATLQDLVTNCLNAAKDCGHFKGKTAGAAAPAPATAPTTAPTTAAARNTGSGGSATTAVRGTPSASTPVAVTASTAAAPADAAASTAASTDSAGAADGSAGDPAASNSTRQRRAAAADADQIVRSRAWYLASGAGPIGPVFPIAVLAFGIVFFATAMFLLVRRRRSGRRGPTA